MHRWLLILNALLLTPPVVSADEIVLHGQTFTLPAGFTIEVAAATPLVERPITCDFDEQGRLFVAESSGSNEKVDVQLQKKPHRIVRLDDVDGDGRFDRRVVFAEGLMLPEGTLWFDGSLYVAAPPSIWKLTDRNGDGVADERLEWFAGKTLTGCANDLHGPYLGRDGRIYWCKGAFAEQTYPLGGAKPWVTKASHLFRAKPDGSSLEPVMTGGMDNPVDMVFTRGGERIVSGTFLVHPAGGKRDGLIHSLHGGVYGKEHAVLDGHPRTTPSVLPVLAHHGPAASCGLARYESKTFGKDFRDNLFACLFNLRAVRRHVLEADGATFCTRDSDFLVSSNWDFHPTDVQEDADGSLLVVDTGGWYKLCCPTSQLVKPEALGGIYRIRKRDSTVSPDPRGRGLSWTNVAVDQLAARLEDERPAVLRRAAQELAKLGAAAVPSLKGIYEWSESAELRAEVIWTLTRIDAPSAREIIRGATSDADASVRTAAWHSISLWCDADRLEGVEKNAREAEPAELRVMAEALGRSRATKHVPTLLTLFARPKLDWAAEHSIVYALIEIGDAASVLPAIDSENRTVRCGALLALEAIAPEKIPVESLLRAFDAEDEKLQRITHYLIERHPEWDEALADHLRAAQTASLKQWESQLASSSSRPAIQRLLGEWIADADRRAVALRAIKNSRLKNTPDVWVQRLTERIDASGFEKSVEVNDVLNTLSSLRCSGEQWERMRPSLQALAENATISDSLRLSALAALASSGAEMSSGSFRFVLLQLRRDSPERRSAGLDILAKSRLTIDQLQELVPLLQTASWRELDRLLEVIARPDQEALSLKALDAVHQSPAFSTLRSDQLRQRFAKHGEPVRRRVEELAAKLDVDLSSRRERLEEWLRTKPPGDVLRGQAVFTSATAACMNCHAVGYVGGKLGPDLTRIGGIRTEQDLLESILFPSAAFVRSYEPTAIVLNDGRIQSGLIKSESATEIVLVTKPDTELRIARADVEEMLPGTVSIMPAGLEKQLTSQQLADLVAFLKNCK